MESTPCLNSVPPLSRLGVSKMLGGHTARMTADPKWPKGHSILYHVMPRNKTVGCPDSLTHHSGEGVGCGEWAANWWGSTHHSFKTFGLCSQTQYNYPGKIFYHFLSPFLFYKSISIVLTIPTLFFFFPRTFLFQSWRETKTCIWNAWKITWVVKEQIFSKQWRLTLYLLMPSCCHCYLPQYISFLGT